MQKRAKKTFEDKTEEWKDDGPFITEFSPFVQLIRPHKDGGFFVSYGYNNKLEYRSDKCLLPLTPPLITTTMYIQDLEYDAETDTVLFLFRDGMDIGVELVRCKWEQNYNFSIIKKENVWESESQLFDSVKHVGKYVSVYQKRRYKNLFPTLFFSFYEKYSLDSISRSPLYNVENNYNMCNFCANSHGHIFFLTDITNTVFDKEFNYMFNFRVGFPMLVDAILSSRFDTNDVLYMVTQRSGRKLVYTTLCETDGTTVADECVYNSGCLASNLIEIKSCNIKGENVLFNMYTMISCDHGNLVFVLQK